jgi:hypothetical protein
MRTVVAVAGDPGGANALLPVLLALRAAGYTVLAWPYNEAERLWGDASLTVEGLSADMDPEERLKAVRPDILLTGTSVNNLELEKRFIAAAFERGLPSLSLLDFWSNYRQRFADSYGALAFVPDRIAIMDESARDAMIAEGFDPDSLVITGQPAFDGLAEFRELFTLDSRACIRKRLGIEANERLVTFLSQPIAEVNGERLGYNENMVLCAVVNALERIQCRRGTPLVLLVRPHPREHLAKFDAVRSATLKTVVSAKEKGHGVALASDLLVGMNTILLLEACLMGAIVVTIQPGLRGEDPLPSTRVGYSRSVYNAADIEPVLEQMLFDKMTRADLQSRLASVRPPTGCASRVVQLIESMLAEGASRR